MKIRDRITRLLPVVTILLSTCAFAAPVWQGRQEIEDGILTVFNPADPVNPPAVITPEQQWRLGGDDTETIFGLITDAQRAPDGTTYLLDAILSTVYEIAPDGEIRRTLGREGDGPGEFRNSVSLALLPDQNLGIMELMPSHMVVLGPDGLDRTGIDLGESIGQGNVQRVAVTGNRLVMGMYSMNFTGGSAEIGQTLGIFDLNGDLRHEVLHTTETQAGGSVSISTGGDNDFLNNWALGPDGRISVYRHTGEYLIEVFGADGQPLHNIRRKYKSVRRPAEEIADQKAQQEEMRQRFGGKVEMEIVEMAPDIEDVIARPGGRLWALSSKGARDCQTGHVGLFDVFDSEGRFTSQLSLAADYNADDDRYLVRGNYLYILKEAQNAPDRSFTGGGGTMMMVMSTGGGSRDDEDDQKEPMPYEVICYELPTGN